LLQLLNKVISLEIGSLCNITPTVVGAASVLLKNKMLSAALRASVDLKGVTFPTIPISLNPVFEGVQLTG
jgi:hypothetical protein